MNPEDFEQSVNDTGDVTTTDTNDAETFDWVPATPANDPTIPEVDTQEEEAAEPSEKDGSEEVAEEVDAREQFIPRQRFDQVNTELSQLRQREAEFAEREAKLALQSRAISSGFADVNEFQAVDKWARENGYGTAEAAIASTAELEKFKAEQQDLVKSNDIPDWVALNNIETKRVALQSQAALREAQRINAETQKTLALRDIDTAIAQAKAQADAAGVSPEQWAKAEAYFRKVGHPQGILDGSQVFFGDLVPQSVQKGKIEANSARANKPTAPAPEGRGGGSAPQQLPKQNIAQIKNTLLSDLLGFRK